MAKTTSLRRRAFLRRAAAAGAGLALAPAAMASGAPAPAAKADDLNLAILGAGSHGRDLAAYALKVAGLRFRAVCDIWPYNARYLERRLRAYRHEVAVYADYRDMLASERDLDAAIIATPDAFHAEQAEACLAAGLHVYCEKEMSNTIAGCRAIVRAARRAGRLVQVGRQHRSNPRYHAAYALLHGRGALGRVTHVSGHWHGHKRLRIGWPAGSDLDRDTLKRYGYDSMEELRNWRWLEKFSGGAIANLGSHQLDVFNWFLGRPPKAVYASGGLDTYDFFQWYDNISCIYEWDAPPGAAAAAAPGADAPAGRAATVRGTYEINTTCEAGGFLETFSGTEGTLAISEDASRGGLWREVQAPVAEWEKDLAAKAPPPAAEASALVRAFGPIPETDSRSVYERHLENFADAIRGKARLACPPEVGLVAAVTALKANEALAAGRRLEFRPEDFSV
jgi:predicted dehydrogenase